MILYIKLISLMGVTAVALWFKNLPVTSILLVIAVTALYISKQTYYMKQRITPLLVISVMIILFQLIFNTDHTFADRLYLGLTAALRILTISLWVFVFTTYTSTRELLTLFSPFPASFQLLLAITFSSIPAIFDETEQIQRVQKSRGLKTNHLNPFSGILPVIVPLLHGMFVRAEGLTITLVSRGLNEK